MLFINFKTYEQGTGESALALVKMLEEVALETGIKIIPVLQAADIKEATTSSRLEIWAQHVDSTTFGAHTGATLPEAIFEDGAIGTFLNHSEHRFSQFDLLRSAHDRALEVGLKTLVFAGDLRELERITALSPTYVAYEPPDLVGSKTTSVAEANPEGIAKGVEIAREHDLPLIVGAGIKSAKDVKKSMELGAVGVAVASDIVAAKDQKKELLELIEGFE